METKKRTKLSPEEKFLKERDKENSRVERERKKLEREAIKAIPKPPKQEASEEELVRKYAKRVIMNQSYHGRVDTERFKGINENKSVNKNLWLDSDFFFSVVFQSQEQKMEFMIKSGMIKYAKDSTENFPDGLRIQIVNGIEYAKALGIELAEVTIKDYPTGNLDLMPFVLDNESSEDDYND